MICFLKLPFFNCYSTSGCPERMLFNFSVPGTIFIQLWVLRATFIQVSSWFFQGAENKNTLFFSGEKLATRLWAGNRIFETDNYSKIRSVRAERLKIGPVALTFRGEAAQHDPGSWKCIFSPNRWGGGQTIQNLSRRGKKKH